MTVPDCHPQYRLYYDRGFLSWWTSPSSWYRHNEIRRRSRRLARTQEPPPSVLQWYVQSLTSLEPCEKYRDGVALQRGSFVPYKRGCAFPRTQCTGKMVGFLRAIARLLYGITFVCANTLVTSNLRASKLAACVRKIDHTKLFVRMRGPETKKIESYLRAHACETFAKNEPHYLYTA